MPHRLQLQELAKKTVDCSNTACTHIHTHTARFKSKRIRWMLTYTHKPPWITTHLHTHSQPEGKSVGRLCQTKTRTNSAEWSDQISVRSTEKRVQKLLRFRYSGCSFIGPVRMKPILSALWNADQTVSGAQSIEVKKLGTVNLAQWQS